MTKNDKQIKKEYMKQYRKKLIQKNFEKHKRKFYSVRCWFRVVL